MSYTSRQGGGSRNSDEDGKPAVSVNVGMQLSTARGVADQAMLMVDYRSCANPSTAATKRSWLRNHSSALPEIHGSRLLTNKPSHRVSAWAKTLPVR